MNLLAKYLTRVNFFPTKCNYNRVDKTDLGDQINMTMEMMKIEAFVVAIFFSLSTSVKTTTTTMHHRKRL